MHIKQEQQKSWISVWFKTNLPFFSATASRQLNVLLCYGSWYSVLLLIAEKICFAWGSRSYQ